MWLLKSGLTLTVSRIASGMKSQEMRDSDLRRRDALQGTQNVTGALTENLHMNILLCTVFLFVFNDF